VTLLFCGIAARLSAGANGTFPGLPPSLGKKTSFPSVTWRGKMHTKPCKLVMKTRDLALVAIFLPLIAFSADPEIVPLEQWVQGLPLTKPAAAGQYEKNGKIAHLTFHFTHTPDGDGTKDSEIRILNNQVHSSGLYVWEWKSGGSGSTYFTRKQADGTDMPNLGGTAYHYLIGNSGTIYKGRPDAIAPASNTHYYSSELLEGAVYDLNGAIVLVADQAEKFKNFRLDRFETWKKGIDYAKWLEGEKEILRGQRITDATALERELNTRIAAQRNRLIAPGASAGHLTISFIGRTEEPAPKAFASAAWLAAKLLKEHGLSTEVIRTHREVASSNCPGEFVQKWVRGVNEPERRGALFDELARLGVR